MWSTKYSQVQWVIKRLRFVQNKGSIVYYKDYGSSVGYCNTQGFVCRPRSIDRTISRAKHQTMGRLHDNERIHNIVSYPFYLNAVRRHVSHFQLGLITYSCIDVWHKTGYEQPAHQSA